MYYMDEYGYLRYYRSLIETQFAPTAIACHRDHVYVSGRETDQIKMFNFNNLNFFDAYHMRGLVTAGHNAISVSDRYVVIADGFDAVDAFKWNSTADVCTFFSHMECIDDVDVKETNTGVSSFDCV